MTAAVTDFSQFAALRAGAGRHDPATLRAVAGQFEALFIETLLKNVRDASLADPIFGQSDQYDMYRGLLDRQLSVEMASGRGIGLAEMLVRQLGGETRAAIADGGPAGSGSEVASATRSGCSARTAYRPAVNTGCPRVPRNNLSPRRMLLRRRKRPRKLPRPEKLPRPRRLPLPQTLPLPRKLPRRGTLPLHRNLSRRRKSRPPGRARWSSPRPSGRTR